MEIEKKNYKSPQIVRIIIDTEIALQLESTPPVGPNESKLLTPEYFNKDPFGLS